MSSSSSSSLDHLSPSEHLCYVHSDTVLAQFFFKTAVTVGCGHCTNLLSVNMRRDPKLTSELFHQSAHPSPNDSVVSVGGGADELPRSPAANSNRRMILHIFTSLSYLSHLTGPRNEIQRIKAGNPHITHREAFSAAAMNWAHFPHIHFGLMPDQTVKKISMRQQGSLFCLLWRRLFTALGCLASGFNGGKWILKSRIFVKSDNLNFFITHQQMEVFSVGSSLAFALDLLPLLVLCIGRLIIFTLLHIYKVARAYKLLDFVKYYVMK
ncbi:hypothetical protein HHK36_000368 [Tetracentron sinense]|uniref:Uncharacterized protein n=1 Tax=Tetracentron sinense TaxID=13715 RepID=A0A834ZRG4_TETSI|nr:hypothetical protein HHK36_000368 [Tetracentron sinense]